MIRKLTFNLEFASGHTMARDIAFEQGGTLVQGANGVGKSVILEMIGYALFGSQALRGKSSDYRVLVVGLDFTVKGQKYTVSRSRTAANLSKAGSPMASGTTAVNQAVEGVLGYGYAVFQIANWCGQGDIQRLSTMRPTERREMVDQVSGLTQLDAGEAWLKDYAAELRAELKVALPTVGVEPTRPPEASPVELNSRLDMLTKELIDAQVATSRQPPAKPIKPLEPRVRQKPLEPKLIQLTPWPEPPHMPNGFDIDKMPSVERLYANHAELTEGIDQLHKQYTPNAHRNLALDVEEVRHALESAQQASEKRKLLAKGSVECGSCGASTPLAGPLLDGYAHIDENYRTDYTDKDLRDAIHDQAVGAQLEEVYEEEEAIARLLEPFYGWKEYHDKLVQWQHITQQIEVTDDHSRKANCAMLEAYDKGVAEVEQWNREALERYEGELAAYEDAMSVWQVLEDDYRMQLAKRRPLRTINDDIDEVKQALSKWNTYELNSKIYQKELEERRKQELAREVTKAQAKDVERARVALKEIRTRVKAYLVPSLARVTTALVSEMTEGRFERVTINPNLDVVVDDAPLYTLSGSEKDVVNIALRIALGQVLTHKVFGVMMMDEVTAAMDQQRAEAFSTAINRITPQIGQVIMISHHDLSGIEFGVKMHLEA